MSGFQGVFKPLDITGSALSAHRFKMEVISGNLAYSEIDSTNDWRPYRRREVTFQTVLDDAIGRSRDGIPFLGVKAKLRVDNTPGPRVPAPDGMDDDAVGVFPGRQIEKSNVKVSEEMIRLLEASRTYEANIAAVKAFREMVSRALTIGS
jgi:flagellar basal-body rod protein FlgC